VALAAAAAARTAGAQSGDTGKSDWERAQEERDWREAEAPPPPPPGKGELVEFFVSSASDFRFFIDAASLAPGKDGVIRYTLVARSPLGSESITYEGIRCATGEVKTYAYGKPDGGWSVRPSPWRPIEMRSVKRWHSALWREYLCVRREPVRSAAEGIDALKRGGHPESSSVPERGY
jgi:hypothetical protein